MDDFIAVLLSAPGFLAEFMQSPAAIAAAELHVEQAAAEQAAHVEAVLRLQMEIRTLAVDIGMQEQAVAGVISAADCAAADRAAADHSAGCAKAERAAAAHTLEEAKSLQADAKQAAAEAQAERKRAAKERTAAQASSDSSPHEQASVLWRHAPVVQPTQFPHAHVLSQRELRHALLWLASRERHLRRCALWQHVCAHPWLQRRLSSQYRAVTSDPPKHEHQQSMLGLSSSAISSSAISGNTCSDMISSLTCSCMPISIARQRISI